ncbi:hypothetical protein SAMN05421869_101654 [Nonomuraea jiangxiensis]|uniref:MYXO-CTERM domain-containing protein n=1 Tax=Nonomuraea jiangxiensis TaxID=633440 RepID=A0A1G8A940_9ACTN|nr:hypothetical protein SAMN05421869_101654 [Nonomuraea jiangxiensis]
MRRRSWWRLLTVAAAFLYAAAPMPPAGQTPYPVAMPGVMGVAAADDDDDDHGDDHGDDDNDDDDDEGDHAGDHDGDDVRWIAPQRDRVQKGMQGRTSRSSRRGERSRRQPDPDADTVSKSRETEPGPSHGDGATTKSGNCEDCAAVEMQMGTPSTHGDSTDGYQWRALVALTAIAGTAALLGAAYWLMPRLDPRHPVPSSGHAPMDIPEVQRDPGRPPVVLTKVTLSRAQRSQAGWRWRRSPGERGPT